jgi:hypothetical protein
MEWRQLYIRTNTILLILFTCISFYWYSVIIMHVHTLSVTVTERTALMIIGGCPAQRRVNGKSEHVHSSRVMHTDNADRPGSTNLGLKGMRPAVRAVGWNCDGGTTVLGQARSVGWHPGSRTTSRAATRGDHRAVGSPQEALRAPSPAELVSTTHA